MDNDGDMDVLGAAGVADDITWWENDGSESFTKRTIDGDFDTAQTVFATDLDGDGDIDVLGAAQAADDITWWENDDDAPTLSSKVPADGASSVAITSNLTLTFSENMGTTGTGYLTIYKSSDDSVVEQINTATGAVTGSGTDTITVNPSSDLEGLISYYIKIDGMAFYDLAGNSYAGISDTTTWNFTTVSSSTTAGGGGGKIKAGLKRKRLAAETVRRAKQLSKDANPTPVTFIPDYSGMTSGYILSKEGITEDEEEEENLRLKRLKNRLKTHASPPKSPQALLPPTIVTTGDSGSDQKVSKLQERTCARVERRFSGFIKMLERINERLMRRFGFVCE